MSGVIGNEAIRASAGTGKTYALVTRYLRLLANGVDPSTILALTFTRMAAGEFLRKIFARLLPAAAGEKEAAVLGAEIGRPEADAAFFREKLQELVHAIGDLHLLTIDSYFAQIVAAFPFELGLNRPHVILQDYALAEARREVLRGLLNNADGEEREQMLRLFKEHTFGREEKNVLRVLTEVLKNGYDLYLEAGEAGKWGHVRSIYGQEKPWWLTQKPTDRHKAAADVRAALAGREEEFGKRLHGSLVKIADGLEAWTIGDRLPGGKVLQQLLDDPGKLGREPFPVEYFNKEYELSMDLGEPLLRLLQAVLGAEFVRSLFGTTAFGSLLELYDGQYGTAVRESGLLVFHDLPVLLLRAFGGTGEGGADLDLGYRLDRQVDHWLLDEFQDTSRLQWRVLEPLATEVLMDPERRRSFFYVGDVKQSLYGWRGGDARLFDEILRKYPADADGGIVVHPLHRSYRSARPVLDCVNAVFGDEGRIGGLDLLPGVKERWRQNWKDHEPAAPVAEKEGFAGVFSTEAADSGPAVTALLQEIEPERRRLSCAVLCRKNERVREIALQLREAGFNARMEGKVRPGNDNVLGLWIQAFVRWIEQPEQTFPRGWLGMTSAGGDPGDLHELRRQVRSLLSAGEVAAAARRLLAVWKERIEASAFLRRRASDLVEAATGFSELRHGGSPRRFADYLARLELDESGTGEGIQVLTIHKAKGLDFDVVVVADMAKQELVSSRAEALHVERGGDGTIRWICALPRKDILVSDPVLCAARERQEAERQFESLCNLYVAMTRAKQGLYCVSTEADFNAGGESLKFNSLLRLEGPVADHPFPGGLSLVAGFGNPAWYQSAGAVPAGPPTAPRLRPLGEREALPRVALRMELSPSQEAHGKEELPVQLAGRRGARFGSKVHAFLAGVDWLPPGAKPANLPGWEALDADVRERLETFLAGEKAREIFTPPPTRHELWREKPFVLREEDRLRTGIIDRALVFRGEDGQPCRAALYDFKTDQLDAGRPAAEQLQERYALQLERYREAVAVLTGLSPEAVEVHLVPV
ncbi:MAG: UvrD-helicase domain-containing protein [Verrucomicrobia bacterium]|jgi:ATP-dependent exoDNAse (exonuclease V) beta subunit|nr:UvrD-helicase domain-containing protein [Verrucomicrobiota bacterium]